MRQIQKDIDAIVWYWESSGCLRGINNADDKAVMATALHSCNIDADFNSDRFFGRATAVIRIVFDTIGFNMENIDFIKRKVIDISSFMDDLYWSHLYELEKYQYFNKNVENEEIATITFMANVIAAELTGFVSPNTFIDVTPKFRSDLRFLGEK